MEPTVNAADALLNTGIMGAVFVFVTVPLAIFVVRLSKALSAVQEKRVEEARAITTKLIELSASFNQTTAAQVAAAEAQRTTLCSLKDSIKEIRDKVEKVSERL